MVFRDKAYSVLLVTSGDKFRESMVSLLPPSDYYPVEVAATDGEARRKLAVKEYDIVLINTPLTDDYGTRLAMDICNDQNSGVMLFVKADAYDDVYDKVLESGAMLLSKPASAQMILQTLRNVCASRERLRRMQAKQASVEDKIKEIRIINKAKWLLIEQQHMTEAEAHRYIEKQAMDTRESRVNIAKDIINKYD